MLDDAVVHRSDARLGSSMDYDEAESWPMPVDVAGLRARLSTFRNAEVEVVNGAVRLNLENYTGVVYLTPNDIVRDDGRGDEGRPWKRSRQSSSASSHNSDFKTPKRAIDPETAETVKKMTRPEGGDIANELGGGVLTQSIVDDDQKPITVDTCSERTSSSKAVALQSDNGVTHVLEKLEKAGTISVKKAGDSEKGVFALLGNGKSPVRNGTVKVHSSGYDPSKRKPDDIVAGKKSGDGCFALPKEAEDGSISCFFEFALRGGIELWLQSYALRNGSKDQGTFPREWVLEVLHEGTWKVIAEEYTEQLDGTRQAFQMFQCRNGQAGDESSQNTAAGSQAAQSQTPTFGSRFRIKSCGPTHERHPLWLSMVEFYGVLRAGDTSACLDEEMEEMAEEGGEVERVVEASSAPVRSPKRVSSVPRAVTGQRVSQRQQAGILNFFQKKS